MTYTLKNIGRLAAISLLTAVCAGTMCYGRPADQTAATSGSATAAAKAKKTRAQTFAGKITALDKIQKTVTLTAKGKDHVFLVTPTSRFTKTTKPATMDELTVGEEVTVRARSKADGKFEVVSIRSGAKSSAKSSGKSKASKGKKAKEALPEAPAPGTTPTPPPSK